ncbi:helix-turn-helix transcriptional regulator [Paenibacillus planticolens]|uniref:Helix-turn-helix domain-containing protein n=1 Tax=Paenibacillus planticolens TaxID=2654976 RepID=A0ABX1ZWJ6_9BACL|nr:helix-turn-helix domain-containing protein [Paenibacillus planticolens]NOV04236.1 helix-turn-helix domain-containing protein [Paenibacillus planticolens]
MEKIEKIRFDELREIELTRYIKAGTNQEIEEEINKVFRGVEAGDPVQDYQIYMLEILTCILKAAKDLNLDIEVVLGEAFVPFTQISNFTTMEEARIWLTEICINVKNHIAAKRQSTFTNLVDRAKEYTKKHYHLGDISINKVCSHLHISTGYFSSIFKKETKMTFVNYLNDIRLEAGMVLLRTTDMRALEIAEKVGYSDANYFSFSFRKKVGVTPREYRNSFRGV